MKGRAVCNFSLILLFAGSILRAGDVPAVAPVRLKQADAFPFVAGTQTIGPAYQFTQGTKLVETAGAIREMGSNTLKFALRPEYFGPNGNVPAKDPAVRTLTELARDEPSHRKVLDMPFSHVLLWAYCFTAKPWGEEYPKSGQDREYREIYDLACHLLRTYDGTGRTFYLGNWEGDWALLGHYDAGRDPGPARIKSMIAWLNVRQRAVDDAKKVTPHRDVEVYHYVEVNQVVKAMRGKPTVTNDVLPHVDVDFVSYSAYDALDGDISKKLPAALDYIEQKLPRKPAIPGRRVFVGEYGFPAQTHTPQEQDRKSREVLSAAIHWGCRFCLYWSMYNNEVTEDGKQRGYWMIDDKGVKQPVYETHRRYFAWAKEYLMRAEEENGRPPTPEAFRAAAAAYLRQW